MYFMGELIYRNYVKGKNFNKERETIVLRSKVSSNRKFSIKSIEPEIKNFLKIFSRFRSRSLMLDRKCLIFLIFDK